MKLGEVVWPTLCGNDTCAGTQNRVLSSTFAVQSLWLRRNECIEQSEDHRQCRMAITWPVMTIDEHLMVVKLPIVASWLVTSHKQGT